MFYDNLKEVCEEKNISISKITVDAGGAVGSINGWKKGAYPNSKIVEQMCLRLNVSADRLLFGKKEDYISEETPNQSLLSPDKIRLLEMYDRLTDMEKGEILGELKQMLRAGSQAAAPEAASAEQPKIHIARSAARSWNNIPPKIEEGDFSDLLNAPDSTDDYSS